MKPAPEEAKDCFVNVPLSKAKPARFTGSEALWQFKALSSTFPPADDNRSPCTRARPQSLVAVARRWRARPRAACVAQPWPSGEGVSRSRQTGQQSSGV